MPPNVRAQLFAAGQSHFFERDAMFDRDLSAPPALNDAVIGKLHSPGQGGDTPEFVDAAVQGRERSLFHASIVDRKTIPDTLSINNMQGMTTYKRIQAGRKALNLTAQEFADRLGVTRGAVQQWEKAHGTAPSRRHQKAVAAMLGLTIPELMNPDPNAGEQLAAPAIQPAATPSNPAQSENARVLAVLFDMLPDDLVKRTEAYNAASAEIIAVLHGRPRLPAPIGTPVPHSEPEKPHA